MEGTRSVRSWFDRLAPAYRRERYAEDADPWRRSFFEGRRLAAHDLLRGVRGRVLDLGSGPGILGPILPAGVETISLDLSTAMLAEAGGRAVAADATAIPLPDHSVDAVVALGLTTYVRDLDRLLAQIARVLRPGGRLVIGFTRRHSPDTMLRAAYRALFGRFGGRGVLASGLGIHARSDGEAERALARAGFGVRGRRLHNFTVFPFAYLFKRLSIRIGEREEIPDQVASDVLVSAVRLAEPPRPTGRRKKIVRVIARLNVGGPSRQAILLTRRLDPERYDSVLVTGRVSPHEADMTGVARERGIAPIVLDGLGRAPSPLDDLRAFLSLVAILWRERPDVVHTHTAKAGALGRVAALLTSVPTRIHTFHGHVLHGYFGRTGNAVVRAAEMFLGRLATRIVAVSPEVKSDLAGRHRILPAERIGVVPLGLELEPLYIADRHRGALRRELGIGPEAPLIAMVGRVTPVKEPEVALAAMRRVVDARPDAVLALVGGGEMLDEVREQVERLGLGDSVRLLGWRSDLPVIFADADVALLTSRNEGTPVALIEAGAAAVPAVATDVGGVRTVVEDGETGVLTPRGDDEKIAEALLELLDDPARRRAMGAAARARIRSRFSAERLLADIARLYESGGTPDHSADTYSG
ncbi:MAG: glycosyltransferase [Planctomycetota bacterium]